MIPPLTVMNTASVLSQSMQPSETLSRMFDELKSKCVGSLTCRDKAVRTNAGKELGGFVGTMDSFRYHI